MDADEDPPDADWPVHPASAFYGLWPRFAAKKVDGVGEDAAEPVAELERI
jgi:hypothetical protein